MFIHGIGFKSSWNNKFKLIFTLKFGKFGVPHFGSQKSIPNSDYGEFKSFICICSLQKIISTRVFFYLNVQLFSILIFQVTNSSLQSVLRMYGSGEIRIHKQWMMIPPPFYL